MDKDNAEQQIQLLKKQHPEAAYYLHFSSLLELTLLLSQVRDEIVNATTPALFRKPGPRRTMLPLILLNWNRS